MRGINKAMVIGTLGDDPTINVHNGTTFATLSIATNESWKDKQTGEQREETEWHRVSLSGRLAEVARDYLHKGSQVYVEGKLKTRKWQDKDGNTRYTTEIKAFVMQMLGGKGQQQSAQKPAEPQDSAPDFDDLEIPF